MRYIKTWALKKDAIVIINTPWKNRKQSRDLVFLNKIKAMLQVELASLGSAPPSSGNTNSTNVTFTDGKKEVKTDLELKFGDETYIKTLSPEVDCRPPRCRQAIPRLDF